MKIIIYIDSDVFIASEIQKEKNHKISKKFIEYVTKVKHSSELVFATSSFTPLELASAMARRVDEHRAYSLLYRVKSTWEGKITPLDPKEKRSFKKLINSLIETAIQHKTSSGDSIHAQTIEDYKIDYLITWNTKDFKKLTKKIKKLKVLTPAQILNKLDEIEKKTKGEERILKIDPLIYYLLKKRVSKKDFNRLKVLRNYLAHNPKLKKAH